MEEPFQAIIITFYIYQKIKTETKGIFYSPEGLVADGVQVVSMQGGLSEADPPPL
jgi:hypothetical protein